MKVVLNTIVDYPNGDRKIIRGRIETDNIEELRERIMDENYPCRGVRFTYEEKAINDEEERKK